jgi:hypothetical protein
MSDNKLPEGDIKVGAIIWYRGYTSTFSWDCPAEIYLVNCDNRTFKVKSLDDMENQNQDYSFDIDIYSPESRLTMRIPDADEVKRYLNSRANAIGIEILRLQDKLREKEAEAKRFTDYLPRLLSKVEKS